MAGRRSTPNEIRLSQREHAIATGRAEYRIDCLTCGPNHWTTREPDAAWDEAGAHERATGHVTHVEIVVEGA